MRAIKDIRLKNYDYSQSGYCFVTIASHLKQPLLGHHKELIEDAIVSLAKTKGLRVDYHVVMNSHLHLILILEDCELSLGEIIRRFKAAVSKRAGSRLWQPNYYEHVIRNDKALLRIREYIEKNPMIEKIKFAEFYDRRKAGVNPNDYKEGR
jgi:putative transposase